MTLIFKRELKYSYITNELGMDKKSMVDKAARNGYIVVMLILLIQYLFASYYHSTTDLSITLNVGLLVFFGLLIFYRYSSTNEISKLR